MKPSSARYVRWLSRIKHLLELISVFHSASVKYHWHQRWLRMCVWNAHTGIMNEINIEDLFNWHFLSAKRPFFEKKKKSRLSIHCPTKQQSTLDRAVRLQGFFFVVVLFVFEWKNYNFLIKHGLIWLLQNGKHIKSHISSCLSLCNNSHDIIIILSVYQTLWYSTLINPNSFIVDRYQNLTVLSNITTWHHWCDFSMQIQNFFIILYQ